MSSIHEKLIAAIRSCGISGDIELSSPPNEKAGDVSFSCFKAASYSGEPPADVAKKLSEAITKKALPLIDEVLAVGPYVNFFLNAREVAKLVIKETARKNFGAHTAGKGKKYLVEYACPNPMKPFHIGHLRNTVSGESVCRILENAGYEVVRVNYQGDVGMHIAKTLWGIALRRDEYEAVIPQELEDQVKFLGRAYALGSRAFDEDEEAKQEILVINKKVYARDESVSEVYDMGREWSLEYFHTIYTWLDAHFDEMYFESEVWERGLEIVREHLEKGVFKESDGAVIFPGSQYGLHDRVFITGEGNPTYEAKDLALSERRFKKHKPDKIIHIVGKEQTEYFKVVFKALEYTLPNSRGKEFHLPGGYLQTKGGKMSSRTGRVQLAEDLLCDIEGHVKDIMKDSEADETELLVRKIALSAIKYAIVRVGVSDDVMFDMKESVQVAGESGPYLLYIVARVKSLLRKAGDKKRIGLQAAVPDDIHGAEKQLLLQLAQFPIAASAAAEQLNPAKVAHYLFDLAQKFNTFYQDCQILQAQDLIIRNFRLALAELAGLVMERGLYLLSIETVEEM